MSEIRLVLFLIIREILEAEKINQPLGYDIEILESEKKIKTEKAKNLKEQIQKDTKEVGKRSRHNLTGKNKRVIISLPA